VIQTVLKQRGALSTLLFDCGLEHAIKKVQQSHVGLKLNGTYLLVSDVSLLWNKYSEENPL
jgi:hypothetical protein